jgi:hypothetical protein
MLDSAIEIEMRQREAVIRMRPHVQATYRALAEMSDRALARVNHIVSVQIVIQEAQPRYLLLAPPSIEAPEPRI